VSDAAAGSDAATGSLGGLASEDVGLKGAWCSRLKGPACLRLPGVQACAARLTGVCAADMRACVAP
jgi:hypothetical protein